ncbi:MAG: virulence factor SrfB, partial [Deltaproteobacteria bacterium]|nr:virulence factor SrfB [Deltaproteobacteria bacterium]
RRIIFTVPIAMPVAEQRIYRRWVNWAVRVVWDALGWGGHYLPPGASRPARPDYRLSPQVRCDWDEASCTQLVHLYSELSVKYHGDAHHFFRLLGKERGDTPSLRVASIDIGGGTTDLSITTFKLISAPTDTARISPQLEFRDGFNIAGDEVLREVIAKHVLQALHDELARHGVRDPRTLLHQLFGKGAIGSSQEERNLRSRFVRQVAAPVALSMLAACELREHDAQRGKLTYAFADFFEYGPEKQDGAQPPVERRAPRPQENVIRYLEDAVLRIAPDSRFKLMDTPVHIAPTAVAMNIRATLDPVLADLCEIVHLYDCDILLLSGRPSAWEAVVQSVLAKLPVPPDRVVPMREYYAGGWYPFADALGRITDPKTSVVVGAILCALAEGHLEGFSYDTSMLRLSSTARFIGELDTNGQLQRPKVWFEVDVNTADSVDMELARPILFSTPLPVGYRQLDAERWPTTRYYLLNFASEAARSKAAGKTPYTVNLRLVLAEMRDDAPGERDEGEFEIVDVTNRNGESVPRSDLVMHLQTLPLDEGYWLDTGTVYQD